MLNNANQRAFARGEASAVSFDEGLRRYMLRVYNLMVSGVLLTGIVSLLVSTQPELMRALFGTPLRWLLMLAPFAFVMVLSFGVNKLSPQAATGIFFAFAATMGLSLSSIFLAYTGGSIARVFFITAATFAAMSLYGYTTKADLSRFGSFLVMGLFGLIIASLVNMFFPSGALNFAISVIGVLIFVGLTAWDTQKIKEDFYGLPGGALVAKSAVMGALTLYLDFINLFIYLLRLLGSRND